MSDYIYGQFMLPCIDDIFQLGPSNTNNDIDNEILRRIFEADFDEIEVCEVSKNMEIDSEVNQDAALDDQPPSLPSGNRFGSVSEEDIQQYEAACQSNSTKRNTTWIVKLLQDWHREKYGQNLEMATVTPEALSHALAQFYCEAKTKNGEIYHKNSLKNIRAGINRHLQDIGRQIDIVHDIQFKSANRVLDGMLKEMVKSGKSKPTQHKPVIEGNDLRKIGSYFQAAYRNPIILRQAIWYYLSVHFCSRGLEFHHQLQKNSFQFMHDDSGYEYVTLSTEYQQKNFQGGLNSDEAPSDKRMYATGQLNCPVRLLRIFLDKTDDEATLLFNCCNPDALSNPTALVWYINKPLSKRSFSCFMPDICKSAQCSQRYTAHSLRATAITTMSEAGFEARHIMYMSGHRNEASLRSYSRNLSVVQKRRVSATLSSVSDPTFNSSLALPKSSQPPEASLAVAPPSTPCTSPALPSTTTHMQPFIAQSAQPVDSQASFVSNESRQMFSSSQGLLSYGTFYNCTFNFNMKQ